MMFRRRNTPENRRPWLVRWADWVDAGSSPAHPDAPSLQSLRGEPGMLYQDEDTGRWHFTAAGQYEVARQRAGGAPPIRYY